MLLSTDKILEKITIARIGLLLRHPFFGNLATRLIIEDGSEWCQTAATDGRHLFYNKDFFETLSNKEVEFVVAHEILHNVFDHISRTEGRNPTIWNAAIDYATNGQLVRDKIGEPPKNIKIFHNTNHYGKSAEQIYDEIYDEEDEKSLMSLGNLLDQHIDWSADSDQKYQNKPSYSKEELRKIRDEIRESVIAASQSAGIDKTPAEIRNLIQSLTEPKMNWRQILRQQIQSTIRNDYTWSRPSRKSWHTGVILPGMNFSETIDIAIGIDTSGSISEKQIKDFLSEIKGIMEEYKEYKIKIWCFDTLVHNVEEFDSYSEKYISEYMPTGGGGTDFNSNWRYMKDFNIQPKKFIMFTDMYPGSGWGDDSYCDTVFINHGRKGFSAPFGITVEYEDNV